MKIGVCVADYDIRNDLLDLVRWLATRNDVVLLGIGVEWPRIQDAPCEKRRIEDMRGLWNRCWYWFFQSFGKIPRSRENFKAIALLRIHAFAENVRRKAERTLRRRMRFPYMMSFDTLLGLTRGKVAAVDDLDALLFITNISSPALLAQARHQNKRCLTYVYSWDHACKYDRFPRDIQGYLVWNEGIASDLVELQDIPRDKIRIIGSTQLVCIQDYFRSPELRRRRIPEPYIYYGCGVAVPSMAEQECLLIDWLAQQLALAAPAFKLIVRPYPMLRDTTSFRRLRSHPNIAFDDQYRDEKQERAIPRGAIYPKLNLMEYATAFFHCGTTMGFECAFFDTPVFFLDPQDFDYGLPGGDDLHLSRFIRQYQNEKYMKLPEFPNVINRTDELRPRVEQCLRNPDAFLAYNRAIRATTPLRSMDDIGVAIENAL